MGSKNSVVITEWEKFFDNYGRPLTHRSKVSCNSHSVVSLFVFANIRSKNINGRHYSTSPVTYNSINNMMLTLSSNTAISSTRQG